MPAGDDTTEAMIEKMKRLEAENRALIAEKRALEMEKKLAEIEARMEKPEKPVRRVVVTPPREEVIKPKPAPVPAPTIRKPRVGPIVAPPEDDLEYYRALHTVIMEFIGVRSIIDNIEYGVVGLGGLQYLESMYCSTAMTDCDAVGASKAIRDENYRRCAAVKRRMAEAEEMDPYTMPMPPELRDLITERDEKVMRDSGKTRQATLKAYLIGGRRVWAKELLKGEVDNYRALSASDLAGFATTAKTRWNTIISFYRYLNRIAMYLADRGLKVHQFGAREMDDLWAMVVDWDYEKKQASRESQLAKSRAFNSKVKNIMRSSDCTRAEAVKCALPDIEELGEGTKANYIKYAQQFFTWMLGGAKIAKERGMKYQNYFKVGDEFRNPMGSVKKPTGIKKRATTQPYRLSIDENKHLAVKTDDVIHIYRRVLNAHENPPHPYNITRRDEWRRRMRLLFILLRVIREAGARPANVAMLQWRDFVEPENVPVQIDWTHARETAMTGKNPPEYTYISKHLMEDVNAYIKDYETRPDAYVATSLSVDIASAIKQYLKEASSAKNKRSKLTPSEFEKMTEAVFGRLDTIVSRRIAYLSTFTCPVRVLPIRFRRSLFTLVYLLYGDTTTVEELTGDTLETVKKNYRETGGKNIKVHPDVQKNKFGVAEMARKIFDREYPTTGIPERYEKEIPV